MLFGAKRYAGSERQGTGGDRQGATSRGQGAIGRERQAGERGDRQGATGSGQGVISREHIIFELFIQGKVYSLHKSDSNTVMLKSKNQLQETSR